MANIGLFNPAEFKPFEDFSTLPKGEYNAIVSNTVVVSHDDKGNQIEKPKLVITFQVVEGAEKGSEISENLFLWLPKDGSKSGGSGEISRRKMSTIVAALGHNGSFTDTAIFHGKPLTIKTDIRFSPKKDAPGEYIGFPDIKSFKPYAGPGNAAGVDPVQPQAPVAPAAPAAGPAAGFGGGFAMPTAPVGAFPAPAAPMGFPGAAPVAAPAPMAAPAGFQMPQAPAAPQAAAFAPQGFAPAAPGGFPGQAAPAPFQPVPGAPSPFGAPGR